MKRHKDRKKRTFLSSARAYGLLNYFVMEMYRNNLDIDRASLLDEPFSNVGLRTALL